MNKIKLAILFKLFLFSNIAFDYIELAAQTSYVIQIKKPEHIISLPPICAYYKGYKLNFDNDFCIINESMHYSKFMLVITEEINHKISTNFGSNIQYLKRYKNKPCRIFSILEEFDTNKSRQWKIYEENLKDFPIRLPDNSLVILINPEYLDSIEQDKVQDNFINIINLPILKLKSQISKDDIIKSSVRSALAALDSNTIHTTLNTKIKNESLRIIALADSFNYDHNN